jgi:hypothetical protein
MPISIPAYGGEDLVSLPTTLDKHIFLFSDLQSRVRTAGVLLRSVSGTITTVGTAVTGTGTSFQSQLQVGDYIGNATVGFRKITLITSNVALTILSAFLPDLTSSTTVQATAFSLATAYSAKVIGPDNQAVTRTSNNLTYVDPGTKLITLAQNNIPRFEAAGLNLEPESISQLCQSTAAFSSAPWVTQGGLTVTAPPGTIFAPDGTSTAWQLNNPSAGSKQLFQQIQSFPGNDTFSFSVYLMPVPGDLSPPKINLYGIFQQGIGSPQTFPNPLIDITLLPNSGWRRYDVIIPVGIFNSCKAYIQVQNPGAGAKAVYAWGAQFTESTATFSYRPRGTNAAAIDGQERLTYPIEAFGLQPNSQDVTFIWEFIPIGDPGFHYPLCAIGGGASDPLLTNMFTLGTKFIGFGGTDLPSNNGLALYDEVSAVPVTYVSPTTYTWSRYSLQRWAWKIFNAGQAVSFFANGLFLGTQTFPPLPTDGGYTKFAFVNGAIQRKLEMYPYLFTDANLQDITTVS